MTSSTQSRTDVRIQRSEFYRPVKVDKIRDGHHVVITASCDECDALARRFSLLAIERLQADVRIKPGDRGVFVLSAKMSGRVVQACTVTQKPVPEKIDCAFSVSYSLDSTEYWGSEKGHDSDMEEEYADPPEPIMNGEIDMGECVAEQLILEITPYPRVHGASFVDIADDAPGRSCENGGVEAKVTGGKSPFAVLERLKQNANEKS